MTAVPEPFAWNATFDVKHDVINAQHTKLFDMIADLDANRADAEKLNVLLAFVQEHFKLEEDLFEAKAYADKDSHKATHDKFVSDAVGAVKDGVSDAVIAFLKDWLVNHIMVSDMAYVGKL